jgi:tetratricopeptide (TPR) repeat protein
MQDRSPDLQRAGDTLATTGDPQVVPDGAGGAGILAAGPGLAARYRLGEEIARGGMGVVCRATDTVLGREVAVKVLQGKYAADSGIALRFVAEARITGQLQHPGIPAIHDLGILPDGRPFLAMKLIKGETLDQLLRRRDAAAGRGGVAVFEQVCQAVAYAHAHGVVHRDLKPANIMVGAFGEVQVMDWGLAKVLTPGQAAADKAVGESQVTLPYTEVRPLLGGDLLTHSGSVLGTPAYMPPEQAIGAVDQIDARSDVFGLGGVLAAVLTGQPPFVGDSAENSRQLAARGKVHDCFSRLDVSGADPELVTLCKRCLSPEKADRPADAGEVAAAVAALRAAADERARRAELERVRVEGEQATALARSAERRKWQRMLLAASGAIALALLAGLSVSLWQMQRAMQAEAAVRAEGDAKDKALAAESAQRARAEAGFRMGSDTVDQFFTRVADSPQLKSQGFERFRKELLQNAKEFFERSIREQNDAPEAQHDLGVAHHRLAKIQQVLGDYAAAEKLSEKAIEILSGLARSHASRGEYQRDLAASYCGLGGIYLDTYRLDKSGAAYNQAFVVQERLVRDHPTVAEYQRGLAATQSGLGLSYYRRYRMKEAQTCFEAALAIWSGLAAMTPQQPTDRDGLAATQQMLGDTYRSTAQTEKAEAILKQSASTYQALVHDYPDTPEYRDSLGRTWISLAALYQANTRQPQKADAALRQALQIFEKLAREHPDTLEYGYRVGVCYHSLALVSHEGGWDAPGLFEKAIESLDHVVKRGYGPGRDILFNSQIAKTSFLPYALTGDELETIARAEGLSGMNFFNIACVFCNVSVAAENDTKLAAKDRVRLKEQYLGRAIHFLRQAVANGFPNTAAMKSDKELDPLRSREEFQKLVQEVEQKSKK